MRIWSWPHASWREEFLRFHQLRARVPLASHLYQPRKIALCLHSVATLRRRSSGAVQTAKTIRLARLRGLELLEGVGRPLELEQHLAQELACRHDAAGCDDVLLALVLGVGGGAHQRERLVLLALDERGPGRHRESADLHLTGPVVVLRVPKRLAEPRQLRDFLLRRRRIATPRSPQAAREVRER